MGTQVEFQNFEDELREFAQKWDILKQSPPKEWNNKEIDSEENKKARAIYWGAVSSWLIITVDGVALCLGTLQSRERAYNDVHLLIWMDGLT